jgi:uncharacterized membrane protein YidH (DUF202 family)
MFLICSKKGAILNYRKAILSFVAGVMLVALGVAIGGTLNVTWNGKFEISPVEFVTLILTSISVLLALLTIFLAVFAIIGWRSINDGVRDHSMTFLSNELKEGKPMYAVIKTAAMEAMYEGIQRAEEEEPFNDNLDPDSNGDNE